MHLSKLGSRITALVLATAVTVVPANAALAAPPQDGDADASADGADASEADAQTPDGQTPDGEAPDGETPDGEAPDGETPAGETADGMTPDGETADGMTPDGEPSDSEMSEDETAEDEASDEDTEDEDAEDEDAEDEATGDEDAAALAPPGPQRPPQPVWGRKGQYARDGKGMLIAGGVTAGLGTAFIITSVLITRCDFDSALSCRYGDQRDFLVPTAVAATALGGLLIGVGFALRSRYKKWERWTPEKAALVPTFSPEGGGVALVGKF